MGGLVTRNLLMNSMQANERKNVRGVLFLACPLKGSDQAEAIKTDLKPFITPFIPFIDNFGASFT